MHWFWWLVIIFVALIIVNKLSEDHPAFRQVLCCIISIVYPILAIIHATDESFLPIILVGALVLSFYKYVYGIAEIVEEEGAPDVLSAILVACSDGEVTVISIIISVVISVVFAVICILPCLLLAEVSMILSLISLFIPAVYCLITTVLFFRNEYYY